MPYKIKHLDNVTIDARHYLFDANLWIKILLPTYNKKPRDEKYLGFFSKFKSNSKNPKIVLTTLIISEVMNRLLREYGMNYLFFRANPQAKALFDNGTPEYKRSFYKSVYRKDDHYKDTYKKLADEFRNYESLSVFVDDGFGKEVSINDALTLLSKDLDFNDNYFVHLAKSRNYIIVTDDEDFFIEDVEIVTYNSTLHQKAKNSVKPIFPTNTLADIAIIKTDKSK
jgi:predicted nucleic acid-binding protein